MLGKLVGEDRQAMEGDPMNRLLEILQTSLTSKLPPKMSNHYLSDEFLEELEVRSKKERVNKLNKSMKLSIKATELVQNFNINN